MKQKIQKIKFGECKIGQVNLKEDNPLTLICNIRLFNRPNSKSPNHILKV